MRRLSSASDHFAEELSRLSITDIDLHTDVVGVVSSILDDVRKRGDDALKEYTAKFDNLECDSISDLEIDASQTKACFEALPQEQRLALEVAANRIKHYHDQQKPSSWFYTDELGNRLGQKVSPVDSAGVYVPGGQAAYPSTVLMTVIPARVAGVPEIVMVVPAPGKGPGDRVSELVLAAAHLAGVDRIFTIGGAQAIAALAYGTKSVPKVDKIVGPGNAYVAEAKRAVFGVVGIDLIAGPSEILIITDGSVDPEWLVMDMFSQAEHAADAQSLLLCPDIEYLDRIECLIEKNLPKMLRKDIISQSLNNRGALIHTRDLEEALEISNGHAPEHLELAVADPDSLLDRVNNAGAIFCGAYSSEVLGDYAAGPNHVLPTYGAARFSSALGVYDFQKRSSLIQCSREGVVPIAEVSAVLATGEGLQAHAAAARLRLPD